MHAEHVRADDVLHAVVVHTQRTPVVVLQRSAVQIAGALHLHRLVVVTTIKMVRLVVVPIAGTCAIWKRFGL